MTGWRSLTARLVVTTAALASVGATGALQIPLEDLAVARPAVEGGLPGGAVRALLVDRAGFLWVGAGSGLARFDGARYRLFSVRPIEVTALAEGGAGLLVGTTSGLYELRPSGALEPAPVALPATGVTALLVDEPGAVWIGTRAGLVRWQGAASRRFGTAEGLPSAEIAALGRDRAGDLWVATGAGSARWGEAGFESVDSEPLAAFARFGADLVGAGARALVELPGGRHRIERSATGAAGELARALLVDREGALWIGGERLARLRPGATLLDVDDRSRLGHDILALAEDREGGLWIGTAADGLLRVAGRNAAPADPPAVVVDAVVIDGSGRPPAAETKIGAGAGRLEIDYAAAALARPRDLRYRSRLVGYDAGWQPPSPRPFSIYTRLPAGSFRFEVAASLDGERWGEPSRRTLIVAPRWFETLPVRLVAIAALIFAFWGFHRLRLRRLRRREAELEGEVGARTAELAELNRVLGDRVAEQTLEIRETRDMAILTLARLAELRDGTTGEHLERISLFSRRLAQELGFEARVVEEIFRSSPLHDIGKVAIPDRILGKAGPLDAEEQKIMESHTTIGAETLRRVIERSPRHSFLGMAMEIAEGHHERWDGGGYPHRRRGTETPLPARVVALVDAYDAITSARPYKPALPHAEAVERIARDRGTHFEPRLVDVFLTIHEDLERIRREHAAGSG